MTTPETVPEELLDKIEQSIAAGDGFDQDLVNSITAGANMETFVHMPAGRHLVREFSRRAVDAFHKATREPPSDPQRAFQDLLALTSALSILRFLARTIAEGAIAEQQFVSDDKEAAAYHGERLPGA